MKTFLCLCLALLEPISTYPYRGYGWPQRSVMFGGYYGQPSDSQGTMTFASGDSIATNAFAGDQTAEETTEGRPSAEEDLEFEVEATSVSPKRIPKRKPPKREQEEEEEEGGWPFQGGRGPSYNAFFPIMLGGSGGARTRQGGEEGYYPGAATAIANSFSTGKGGVATSHATSFGDPYMSHLFRNGAFNRKAPSTREK